MHLTLTQVVSDITGATGMAIRKALVAGERDPQRLAALRNAHCQHDEDDIAKALQGTWHAEHLFALQQALSLYAFSHQHLALCDQQINRPLATCADKSAGQPLPPKARRSKKTNAPRFAARTPLSRRAIGTAMHRWPRVKHCWSWLGLCPQHKISGGKVLSRRVRLAARSLHHSQSALGAFLRRMQVRLGTPKAITATAQQLARLVSSLLQHGSAYVQQGLDAYETQYRERKVPAMTKQAKALG